MASIKFDLSTLAAETRVAIDALIAQAVAAERERILVPDETLHADGSIGPDSVPAEFSQDPAYWYRRWLFALKQLDKEATERISAYAGMREHLDEVVAVAAAAAERERIRQQLKTKAAEFAARPGDMHATAATVLRNFARTLTDLSHT